MKDSYKNLLDAIRNTKEDKDYKPKNYDFNLNSFDENGEINTKNKSKKNESESDSNCYLSLMRLT